MSVSINELRRIVGANIRAERMKRFPGRGGSKMCAEAFGVTPQQWSPWERGRRLPNACRLRQLADFFGVTVEYLRRDNRLPPGAPPLPRGGPPRFLPRPGIPPPSL